MLSSILLIFLCFLVQLSYENYANMLHLHHSHSHQHHLHSRQSPLLGPINSGKKRMGKDDSHPQSYSAVIWLECLDHPTRFFYYYGSPPQSSILLGANVLLYQFCLFRLIETLVPCVMKRGRCNKMNVMNATKGKRRRAGSCCCFVSTRVPKKNVLVLIPLHSGIVSLSKFHCVLALPLPH